MRVLDVFIDGQRVGQLAERDTLWQWSYDPAWAARPDAFDLSPALPRTQVTHPDGATSRPVQWYFDNLLPEEQLRDLIEREAGIAGHDAFALLTYLGAESAGALTLLPPGQPEPASDGVRPLPDAALSDRIRALPRTSLTQAALKRMSLAGAQHKLLVVYEPGQDRLSEPVGGTPSTHLLKPDHPDRQAYPHSVANEYFAMSLAARVGLQVPAVWRRYVPQPVYLVERFDRLPSRDGRVVRRHIIDACQLLNRSYQFKYRASLDDLQQVIALCRQKLATRQRLWRWLVFNALVGNHDNHLKNLSFTVSAQGIDLAPHYDLLSTAAYHTQAMAGEAANWPYPPLAIALGSATSFHTLTRASLLEAGGVLGLGRTQLERELAALVERVPRHARELLAQIEATNARLHGVLPETLGGELRLLRAIVHVIIDQMAAKLAAGA